MKFLEKLFGTSEPEKPKKKRRSRKKKTDKEIATEAGLPYFDVLKFDFDIDNAEGSIEFDWNDIWIQEARKAGYQGHTDEAIVEQFYDNHCKAVLSHQYENEEAMNPDHSRIKRKPNDDGTTEYS